MIRPYIILATAAMMICGTSPEAAALDFSSTDSALTASFGAARDMAMSYVHDGSDPVGLWYEAALPGRDAFCMRDLAHQALAGHFLGLDDHNYNMFRSIASNISESKDWCSYWETDRLDRPAPCDYANDKEFWYNLPANYDVVRACADLYRWTGDERYLNDTVFVNFYKHTIDDYTRRWQLSPDSIMSRRRFMNTPEPFDRKNGFHTCRGLPSYAENFSGITVAIDLIGAAMQANKAYALMSRLRGRQSEVVAAERNARGYGELLDSLWWDDANGRYNTYYKEDGSFHRGEGLPYMLLIDAIPAGKVSATVDDVLSRDWNVENLSAFPVFLYRQGRGARARDIIAELPANKRFDYPEVSFGIIDGIVRGLMGIELTTGPSQLSVATRHNSLQPDAVDTLTGLPVATGSIDLTHNGQRSSTLTNNSDLPVSWTHSFADGREVTLSVAPRRSATAKYAD